MRKNISNKLLIAGCLIAITGCAAHKQLVVNKAPVNSPVVVIKPDSRLVAIKSHQLVFNTFSAKAATKLNIDGSSNDVTLNMRINHDKKIWVSITALLGIEVARAVITPDSIQIINKLQGVYIKKPFSYIYSYANKQINYKMLEAILVGNAIPEILTDDKTNLQEDSGRINLTGNLQDLVYTLMLNPDMKVAQLNLNNANEEQSLQVANSVFINQGTQLVPSQIDILSASQSKKIQANLHYIRVDLDQPLQYPFNIPESYKPADQN